MEALEGGQSGAINVDFVTNAPLTGHPILHVFAMGK